MVNLGWLSPEAFLGGEMELRADLARTAYEQGPCAALDMSVEISMENAAAPPAAELPGAPTGQAFILGPEGLTFLMDVTITVPFAVT